MSTTTTQFASIDSSALETVAGGASRSSGSSSELTTMLSGITASIKDLASQKDQGQDPMQMMLMMMMMGGMGGGGGGTVAAAAPMAAAPPVINVTTAVRGGGGKKGW